MTLEQTLVVSFTTAIVTALLTWPGHLFVAHLQRRNEKARLIRERLVERYGQFVALVAADLERCTTVRAIMVTGGPDCDYTEAQSVENNRHEYRQHLLQLSFQIKLLEADSNLTNLLTKVADSQPFMAYPFPPRWGEGSYNEREGRFSKDTSAFRQMLEDLTVLILKKYGAKV